MAQEEFTASFSLQRPSSANGGYVTGNITYTASTYQIRYDFDGREYDERLNFVSPQKFGDKKSEQWIYQSGVSCDGCRAGKITYEFPNYVYSSSLSPSQNASVVDGCLAFDPASGDSPSVTTVWFESSDGITVTGPICRALHSDGSDYFFSDVVGGVTIDSSIFEQPDECRCTGEQDIVLMLGRSGTIGRKYWGHLIRFVPLFCNKFRKGPSLIRFALAIFDVETFLIIDFHEGISISNIIKAIFVMNCDCSEIEDDDRNFLESDRSDGARVGQISVDDDDDVCCGRGTSISQAINAAVSYLVNNGRPSAAPIVLLVTDGAQNFDQNGVRCQTLEDCTADLQDAVANAYQTIPELNMFVFETGRYENHTDRIEIITRKRNHYRHSILDFLGSGSSNIEQQFGCSPITYYCDPDECCGLCECGECMPPSGCDESPDFCAIRDLHPPGRCCSEIPRDCTDNSNRCVSYECDSDAGACVSEAIPCEIPPEHADCYERNCDPLDGVCTTLQIGSRTCQEECVVDGDCDDQNACTNDACLGPVGARYCSFTPIVCDDNNPCTEDICVAPGGCQHPDVPLTYCDDGIACTEDWCHEVEGCKNTVLPCNDGLECTTDFCDLNLGRCVYEPKECPVSNDNCTINFCSIGACSERNLCGSDLLTDGTLSGGSVALIAVGTTVGAVGLGAAAVVVFKIVSAPAVMAAGGAPADFLVE
eukprot:TRINITY_DN884_c1_g1_i1.p1 TRINITY_DN884_c1_g1~~TRINITY_DN884_c1_g1_i1.p1  ORF type:complete len:741 (-),score=189.53 TRINITY_DN884_c1_g1_i1:175-2295(-)